MIAYLADTDWMVDFLNGRPEAINLLGTLADDGIAISIITYAELWEGAVGGADAEARISDIRDLARAIDVLGVDEETAQELATLRAALRREGRLIPDFDLVIAATALRHDLALVSRDIHFQRLPGLKRR